MSLRDPMLHPAFIDPRQWGDVNLYEKAFNLDRSPIEGKEWQTPDLPFRLSHLTLDLRFDYDGRRIDGTARLILAPTGDNFTQFELDAAELEIRSVRLLGVESKPLVHARFPDKLSIDLDRAYARNESLTIEIEYGAAPRKGLFFVTPDNAYRSKPRQIWSQGENEDSHWWFPCHDVTNQKMTTELLATVDSRFVVLSNGLLVETRDNADKTKTWHWRLDQPHPAYLISVVIGEYEVVRDSVGSLPVEYYLYHDRIEAGRKLFAGTPRMIDFFARRFGVDFPWPKYSQALVDEFLFGAMENTSATTMTDRCLLDERAELDINYDDIVAHELAHQWWGDLVTCKDWTQIWLNESFATYSEYLWREETCGRDDARFSLFQDFLVYLREDLTSHRRPVACRQYRFSEDLMDRHAYEKGACILHMLRTTLGDEPFFRSLSHYLEKHSFGVAESQDFKIAIEEATGRNLHWFFDQWIHSTGYPEIEVESNWDRESSQLRILARQVQAGEENGTLFRLPLEIEITLGSGLKQSYQIVFEKQEQEFYFPCPTRPAMVLFDKGDRIFKLMRFEKSAEELTYQLLNADEMMDRVRAARELSAFKGRESCETLAAALRRADHPGVRISAAISLGEIGGDAAREALVDIVQNSTDSRLRRTALWALGAAKEEGIIPVLAAAIEKDQSYFAAVAAIRASANIGTGAAWDIVSAAVERPSWQNVVASSVFHGISHAKERRGTDLAITHSSYGAPSQVRVAAIGALGSIGKELQTEKGGGKIVKHLLTLLGDPDHRVRASTIRALGKIGDKSALPDLRERQRHECLDFIRSAILDSISSLEETGK